MSNISSNKKIEPLPKKAITSLKYRMPRGGIKKISEELNVKYKHVIDVLNGNATNYKVVTRAAEIIKEYEKELSEATEAINSI